MHLPKRISPKTHVLSPRTITISNFNVFSFLSEKKRLIINLNSEHITPFPFKDKGVRINESIVSSIGSFPVSCQAPHTRDAPLKQ